MEHIKVVINLFYAEQLDESTDVSGKPCYSFLLDIVGRKDSTKIYYFVENYPQKQLLLK